MQNKATRTVAVRGMLVIMAALLVLIIALATAVYIHHRNDREKESESDSQPTSESTEKPGSGGSEQTYPQGDNFTGMDELLKG